MKEELSRLTIDLPKSYHKKLKAVSAITGKSKRELLVEFIQQINDECLLSDHTPNKKTIDSIENIEVRNDLTEVNDFKDLLKKLGL